MKALDISINESRKLLDKLTPEEKLNWACEQFGSNFAVTTSFGIQSAVLLHMVNNLKSALKIPIIWVDTGYLAPETYSYAEQLRNQLNLNLKVTQSEISPARMEALYGKLWESESVKDLEEYHRIRKIEPLDKAFEELDIACWASGVRSNQTKHRQSMTFLDPIRNRLSIRPLLNWTQKDIFYYMHKNNLPQHPLFEKGYSTVGDWHSSGPDGIEAKGRDTRFGGLKQECGIHLPGVMGDGI